MQTALDIVHVKQQLCSMNSESVLIHGQDSMHEV